MASNPQNDPTLEALVGQKYRHGFVTDIESDTVPPGLDAQEHWRRLREGRSEAKPAAAIRATPSGCGATRPGCRRGSASRQHR